MSVTQRRLEILAGHVRQMNNDRPSIVEQNVTAATELQGWLIEPVWGKSKEEPDALLITMNSNLVNCIDEKFVQDFETVMKRLETEFKQWSHQALLFQAPLNSRNFCAGLNLKRLVQIVTTSPSELSPFFASASAVFEKLYLLPRPTVAFINGNAVAGGFVIAMCCDFRVIVDNPKQPSIMTLREVALGIPLPYLVMELTRTNLSGTVLFETALTGRTFTPKEALELGVVNSLVSVNENTNVQKELIGEAMKLINNRFNTKLGSKAYASIKTSLKTSNLKNNDHMKERVIKETYEVFTSQETQKLIRDMISSRRKKK